MEALDEATHNKAMDLFRKYLLVGGLPDAVNTYLAEKNIQTVREIQREIHDYYAADASKYGEERKLMIPAHLRPHPLQYGEQEKARGGQEHRG